MVLEGQSMIMMVGKQTRMAMEQYLRALHTDPQAADSETQTLSLVWVYETSKTTPNDVSPPTSPHLFQGGHTS